MNVEQEFVDLIIRYPEEFGRGFAEGLLSVGTTYDDDPESDRSVAYDLGRNLRESFHEALKVEEPA